MVAPEDLLGKRRVLVIKGKKVGFLEVVAFEVSLQQQNPNANLKCNLKCSCVMFQEKEKVNLIL